MRRTARERCSRDRRKASGGRTRTAITARLVRQCVIGRTGAAVGLDRENPLRRRGIGVCDRLHHGEQQRTVARRVIAPDRRSGREVGVVGWDRLEANHAIRGRAGSGRACSARTASFLAADSPSSSWTRFPGPDRRARFCARSIADTTRHHTSCRARSRRRAGDADLTRARTTTPLRLSVSRRRSETHRHDCRWDRTPAAAGCPSSRTRALPDHILHEALAALRSVRARHPRADYRCGAPIRRRSG